MNVGASDAEDYGASHIVARVRNMSDAQRDHDHKLIEHGTEIRNIKEGLKEKVSAAQLAHVVAETALKMENIVAENAMQFKHLTQAVDQIQSGVRWIVMLVIAGVVVAVLGLVMKGSS